LTDDLGQAFIKIGVGLIVTGLLGPLMQENTAVPHVVILAFGIGEGSLIVFSGIWIRR